MMKKRTRFAGNKLVRDNTLSRCEKRGIGVAWRELSEQEHLIELRRKLVEEANEVLDAKTPQELVDELADVTEVLEVLIEKAKIVRDEIEAMRLEKFNTRGSFQKGIYIEYFDVPHGSYWHDHCTQQPEKYPVLAEDIE